MSKKLFKTFNIVLLSIVFLVASCWGNVSFADTADTGANITEGIYYIQNVINSDYLGDVDYTYMSLNSYTGLDSQKWEFIYVSDGYYNIRNVSNGRYLTAPANSSTGSEIEQAALSASKTDRQLWKLTETYDITANDNLQCKIQAKSQEAYSLAMATGYTYDSYYGYNVIQDTFYEDTYPSDEWILIPVEKAFLLSIQYESCTDHSAAFELISDMLEEDGMIVNNIYTDRVVATGSSDDVDGAINKRDILNYLGSNDIIAIMSHGSYSDIGTSMDLDPTQSLGTELHSWNIYHYGTNTIGVDMSDCKLAVFVGCYTAAHSTQSLPHAAVDAGAETAIGFEDCMDCEYAISWTQCFFNYYQMGESVDDAAFWASSDIEEIGGSVLFDIVE